MKQPPRTVTWYLPAALAVMAIGGLLAGIWHVGGIAFGAAFGGVLALIGALARDSSGTLLRSIRRATVAIGRVFHVRR